MKNKMNLILLASFFVITFSALSLNAQGAGPLFQDAISSQNGLEASNYKEVALLIGIVEEETMKIGLSEKIVRSRFELRLRETGLIPRQATVGVYEMLSFEVTLLGETYTALLKFLRPVVFEVGKSHSKYSYFPVSTWQTSAIGFHGGDGEVIIKCLDRFLDEFLNEYLKANAR